MRFEFMHDNHKVIEEALQLFFTECQYTEIRYSHFKVRFIENENTLEFVVETVPYAETK